MLKDSNQIPKNYKSYSHIPKRKKQSWLKRYYKYHLRRIQSLPEKPTAIARGFAIGIFSGCFPFFGLQMLIALLLAIICRANKVTAMMGTWISNPFTYVPIFLFNFQVGRFLLSAFFQINFEYLIDFNPESWENLTDYGMEFTLTLLTGSFFIGGILAILSYYIILTIIKKKHKNLHNNPRIK